MKPTIRKSKNKRGKKHWWFRCPLCQTKTHVRSSHWSRALRVAEKHIRGKQHVRKLQLVRRWL